MKTRIWLIVFTLCLGACGFSLTGGCDDTIKAEAKSPDGKYVATCYVRDCGATTDFSTVINLRASSDKFNGEAAPVFVVKGQPKVKISWSRDAQLRIECLECISKDIFTQEESWKEITISY